VVARGGELSCELLVMARTWEKPSSWAVILAFNNGSLQSLNPEGLTVRL
jgi:hypothetical protein